MPEVKAPKKEPCLEGYENEMISRVVSRAFCGPEGFKTISYNGKEINPKYGWSSTLSLLKKKGIWDVLLPYDGSETWSYIAYPTMVMVGRGFPQELIEIMNHKGIPYIKSTKKKWQFWRKI